MVDQGYCRAGTPCIHPSTIFVILTAIRQSVNCAAYCIRLGTSLTGRRPMSYVLASNFAPGYRAGGRRHPASGPRFRSSGVCPRIFDSRTHGLGEMTGGRVAPRGRRVSVCGIKALASLTAQYTADQTALPETQRQRTPALRSVSPEQTLVPSTGRGSIGHIKRSAR